jgi:hypothetical protein
MLLLRVIKDMFKKMTKKIRKYADGGNVAGGSPVSGSPSYGFGQANPMQAGGLGALRPAPLSPQQQGMAPVSPPAFAPGNPMAARPTPFKKGGKVKAKAKSKKSSASRRGDGIASKGKTRGKMV